MSGRYSSGFLWWVFFVYWGFVLVIGGIISPDGRIGLYLAGAGTILLFGSFAAVMWRKQ